MKKYVWLAGLIACCFSIYLIVFTHHRGEVNNDYQVMEDNPSAREAYFNKLLADPATGKVPENIRTLELAFDQTLPVNQERKRNEQWTQRGPDNVGGRTRAFGINSDNPDEMLAGAATGGIYKSLDGGKTWSKTTCPLLSISCMVQDIRPGKTSVWYAGTGELSGSSGSSNGAYYYGAGILKSTDGGNTWNILSSTAGSSITVFDNNFDGVWNLAIDYSNPTEDEIYAATYGSVYRSVDGGNTWQLKLSGTLTTSYYTDVAVTATGVVYATLSSDGNKKGIWRSADGLSWTNIIPSGFPAIYGRTVIGIAPSNENHVYFLIAGTTNAGLMSANFLGVKEWNSLWKYEFVSGNGSGSGGIWSNRSQNLPDQGGDFGQFNTQGGYDLFVRVKPDDVQTVFLGGTNLWRSTDGYTSTSNTAWIGGYAVNTTRPDFKLYNNHHPDQHQFVFYPGNNVKAFSTHDGGISLTENIMASSVVWEAKNTHYITSQFYTVAIDHSTALDNKIIGGLQDNGTQFTNTHGLGNWQMPYNGDGSYCALKDGSNEIYASAQQGRIAHIEMDQSGLPLKYARIDPSQLYRSDYDFINPFSIDPNNQKILYLPARKRLFRNTDIDAKPLDVAFDSTRWNTPLWEELVNCVPANGEFSAIVASKCNPNTLYYATDAGKIYKVNHANTGQPSPVDISGANFSSGNINCIALDPLDSNKIMVVFSNYNIVSLFSTDDGGIIWRNVSGNLEANANGTGAGPSCRWAAVMILKNGERSWFVGTSTGLYATNEINANPVVWIKQSPAGIGTAIVSMIDVRLQDHYIVAATHGGGVYSANIANAWQTTSVESKVPLMSATVYPNPVTGNKARLVFSEAPQNVSHLALFNAEGKKMRIEIIEDVSGQTNRIHLNMEHVPAGCYWLVVKTGSGTITEKLMVVK